MHLSSPARRRALSSTQLACCALLLSLAAAGCGRSDATVQSDLQQQLAADPSTSSAHLTVTVKEGTAQIAGTTDTTAQQQRVLDIVRAVKGVTQVRSEMRLSDPALLEEVKKAIAADPSVSQIPLRVEVKDAEVKLYSDKTNGNERTHLKDLAGGIPGVAHVEDNMK
jgi:osmotically-inducible protein OsmY